MYRYLSNKNNDNEVEGNCISANIESIEGPFYPAMLFPCYDGFDN